MTADVIRRAAALRGVRRPHEAAALLRNALIVDPDDPALLDALATTQLDIDASAALETARRLLAVNPQGHRGHELAAASYYELGKIKESIAQAELAVAAAPADASSRALLAEALSRRSLGRRRAARAAKHAIELAPDHTLGYVAAGNVELHHGRLRRAARWYEKALAIDPTDGAAQVNLALARQARGRLGSAFTDSERLLALDPLDADARHALDETVYTTLVHMTWVALVLLFIVGGSRGL